MLHWQTTCPLNFIADSVKQTKSGCIGFKFCDHFYVWMWTKKLLLEPLLRMHDFCGQRLKLWTLWLQSYRLFSLKGTNPLIASIISLQNWKFLKYFLYWCNDFFPKQFQRLLFWLFDKKILLNKRTDFAVASSFKPQQIKFQASTNPCEACFTRIYVDLTINWKAFSGDQFGHLLVSILKLYILGRGKIVLWGYQFVLILLLRSSLFFYVSSFSGHLDCFCCHCCCFGCYCCCFWSCCCSNLEVTRTSK